MYGQLLDLTAGALLLTAVLILWRSELAVIVRVFAVQGVALGALVAVLAAQQNTVELWASAAGIVILRAGLLPALLRRALKQAARRETRPMVNVAASLLAVAESWTGQPGCTAPVVASRAYMKNRPDAVLAPSQLRAVT